MSVVVNFDQHDEPIVYVKGAPLETLERCNRILAENEDAGR